MKIEYTPSFFKSLKKFTFQQTIIYKLWSFFRYDIYRFFRNIWNFRKELFEYQDWDWRYQFMMFRRGLEIEVNYLEKHGLEEKESLNKKILKMKRVIELIKYHEDDTFLELAEKQLGYEYKITGIEFKEVDDIKLDTDITKGQKYYELINKDSDEDKIKNKKLSDLSVKISKDTFKELIKIIEGQKYTKDFDWDKDFDGSGIETWWD